MILKKVTVTGADDSTEPKELLDISREYPFVEWGILLSKSNMGRNRFPSMSWMHSLSSVFLKNNFFVGGGFNLSGHICGRWVRDICKGNWTIIDDLRHLYLMFHRFHSISIHIFTKSMRHHS